jgi:hypothetical protein
MAEKDDKNLVPDDIHDIISDEQVDITEEKFEDSEDKKLGFIAKAMDFVKGNRQEDQTDQETAEEEGDTSEAETGDGDGTDQEEEGKVTIADVDQRLVNAARRRGWGDEKILKYYESDSTVLEDVANLMDRIDLVQDKKPEDKPEEKPAEEPKGIKKVAFTDDQKEALEAKYGEGIIAEVLQPILDANNQLVDQVNALSTKDQEAMTKAANDEVCERADAFMKMLDASEKDYPELGKWENVPTLPDGKLDTRNPVVKVRSEIYEVFESFVATGRTPKQAQEDAMLWYGAKQGGDKAEKKVIEKLNGRKKKFINRPGQRKVAKKFESVDDMKRSVVQEAMSKAGIQKE